ncbi:MAG: transglycosylase SLT domain-containing protein [Thiohalocapsa sp.]
MSLLLALAPNAQATGPKIVQAGSRASHDARALIERGKRSEHGVGAAQDIDRAIELYCEAAQLGDAEAHYRLGSIYVTGRAGAVDEPLAASWFHAAAERDNAWARAELDRLGAVDREILPFPDCVLRADMVARRLPRSRPPTGEPARDKGPAAEPSMIVRSLEKRDIQALVRRLAPDYGLDPALVMAVINVESSYNPSARSPKNAQGLMQLIPATASRFGVQNVWDPVDNIRGGMAYLRWLLDHFDGDLELALAGYNAGENAVEKYGGIPPYPETQGYVKRITKLLGRKQTSLASSL